MSKKKPTPPRMGRPPDPKGPREHVLGLKARPEWKAWLLDFANSRHATIAALLVEAVERFAKYHKFRQPPER